MSSGAAQFAITAVMSETVPTGRNSQAPNRFVAIRSTLR